MAMKARNLPVLGPHGFVDLAYWDWEGPPGAPVVLCVHGLTRNGRDFDALAEVLSARFRVVCPDLPGRGKSGWLDDAAGYGFPFYLAVCAALFARLDTAAIDWVGTSLGGLVGMFFAGLPNHPVRRLVLNDVGPFLPKEGLERIAATSSKPICAGPIAASARSATRNGATLRRMPGAPAATDGSASPSIPALPRRSRRARSPTSTSGRITTGCNARPWCCAAPSPTFCGRATPRRWRCAGPGRRSSNSPASAMPRP